MSGGNTAGPERVLVRLDPRGIGTGSAAPLRIRRRLPGEQGAPAEDGLVRSISADGIIQPPLLVSTAGGGPMVVDGFRRVAAAAAAGIGAIDALVLPGETGRAAIARLRLASAPLGAPLSELERITALDRIARFAGVPPGDLPGGAAALFGRALSTNHAERLVALLGMDGDILDLLHEGALSPGDLLRLAGHPLAGPGETAAAARLLGAARLNAGRRREAVGLLLDLADGGPGALAAFAEAFDPAGGTLSAALRRAARPALEAEIASFAAAAAEIGLPAGASVHAPPDLEGGAFTIDVRVRDEETFGVVAGKLSGALERGLIARLLDILKGKDGGGTAVG
ncbi:MAG: ParB N-terminal domain-containing protein [Candidatus Krumholzibacteriota bacterium]|nr:ParB N-terminal domain-containing protein [Candidatus Krumholzibacteriota bacterium]